MRCETGYYALMDGVCIRNDRSEKFPLYCISYFFNETSKQMECEECDKGFGLLTNSTSCIINSGSCVDSVESDCYKYEPHQNYETVLKCESFDRPSHSSIITLCFSSLIVVIFAFISF